MTRKKIFTVEYTDPLSSCITDFLYDQYCAGQHVDVTLRIKTDSVSLHGFLVAVQSDLLNRFPTQPGANNIKLIIDLTTICDSIVHLKSVVDYLYKRAITLDMTNIKAILKLSQYCSLQRLFAHCKQFLLNRIQPYNCLEIWRIARCFHLPDIEAMALSLIREVFWEICNMDPSLQNIGNKEMAFLIDKVSHPRKLIAALEFMVYWVSGNFPERFRIFHDCVQGLISKQSMPGIISHFASLSQEKKYKPLLDVLQDITAHVPEVLNNYYNSPFSHDEDWVLVLSEKNLVSVYFPTENHWTTVRYETETVEAIGILGQTVISWDDKKNQINMFNIGLLTASALPPCPQIPSVFSYDYFCTNTGVHTVTCDWHGCGLKVIIWRYKYGWEKMREILVSYPLETVYVRVEPCPTDCNMVYILLTSRVNCEEPSSAKHGCLVLRYDSLTTRIAPVFTSDGWAPIVKGRLLCINNTINFIEESSSRQFLESLMHGKLSLKSILGQDELKPVDIPIPVSRRKRPGNITVLSDMSDRMNHFDADQFTCYGDNFFWLQQVSPTVVSISVYNFSEDDRWLELPPSPLMGLSQVKMKVFNRNTILRGGFYVNNDKYLTSKDAYPLVNFSIDGWQDEILTQKQTQTFS